MHAKRAKKIVVQKTTNRTSRLRRRPTIASWQRQTMLGPTWGPSGSTCAALQKVTLVEVHELGEH